jgi:hypothetical protein
MIEYLCQIYGYTLDKNAMQKIIRTFIESNPKYLSDFKKSFEERTKAYNKEKKADYLENAIHEIHARLTCGESYDGGYDEELVKALFPGLPKAVKLFFNPMKHKDSYHLGIVMTKMNLGYEMDITVCRDFTKLHDLDDILKEVHAKHEALIAKKSVSPTVMTMTCDCGCCS